MSLRSPPLTRTAVQFEGLASLFLQCRQNGQQSGNTVELNTSQQHKSSGAWRSLRRRVRNAGVRASAEELAGVLIFSAVPFLAVQSLASSSVGRELQQRLQARLPALQAERERREREREQAREKSFWYGPNRPRWIPLSLLPSSLSSSSSPFFPSYLSGHLPGDAGFDPLQLAREERQRERLFNLELLHARWAMLGALGAVFPELLIRYSDVTFLEPVWWRVGYAKLVGDDLDYLGIPGFHIAGGQGVAVIAVAQALLMLGPEYARATGIRALEPLGVFLPGDASHPGGWLFDPLGLATQAGRFEDLKVWEVLNGRLAMVAWLGFAAQAVVTQRGLLDNLHL